MHVWKEVIRPGRYWYQDAETRQPRMLVVTAEGVKHLCDQGNKMLGCNLSVPIPLEHQPDAKPLTPAEKAAKQLLHNAGWVQKYRVLPGSRLFALCDIEDPAVAAKLPRTIKFTSPWINSFTDGDGRSWEGVISHLALTSRPRIVNQSPFPDVAAAMSLATTITNLAEVRSTLPAAGIFVSRAGQLDTSATGASLAHFPAAFSLWSGVKLAGDMPPLKEKKEPPEKKPPMKEEGEEKKVEGEEARIAGMEGQVEEEEMGLVDIFCDLASALWGIELPEDTTEENLLQNALRAMMDHMKSGGAPGMNGAEMADEMGNQPPDGMNRNQLPPNPMQSGGRSPIVQESAPMYMSMEEIEKIADPRLKAMARKTHALEQKALADAKVQRDQRIENLVKRVRSQKFQEKVLAMAKSARFSLSDDGTVADEMGAALDALEAGIKDLPSLLVGQATGVVEVGQPRDAGEVTEDRRRAIVDEFSKNGGFAPASKG